MKIKYMYIEKKNLNLKLLKYMYLDLFYIK